MACSEARLAANRANALKSTGPKTEAGKEVSRRNSLKHGLTGAGVVILGEDAAAVARESAGFLAELAPDGHPTALLLAGRVATLAVRLKRSERHNEAATAERCFIAALDFDEARIAEAERLFGAIDEGTNRDDLRAMPEGLDLLDGALAGLRASAVAGRLSEVNAAQLARCLGGDGRAEGAVGRIDAERARLAALRPGLDVAGIERARAAAVDRALVDDSPATLRARRYEAATERAIHQALREIRRWRSEAAPAPAPAPAAAPPKAPPARDPLTDPSYGIPAHIVREAERIRERLIGLPPLGPGESMAGLGSIFPGEFDADDLDDESMGFDDVPAPRGRSRYEDKRKRPKLGR